MMCSALIFNHTQGFVEHNQQAGLLITSNLAAPKAIPVIQTRFTLTHDDLYANFR